MRDRGIYSMLSAFFLAVVLVFVALGFVYLNLLVVSQESQIFEGTKPFELASDLKTKIIEADYCFNGRITEEMLQDSTLFESCAGRIIQLSNGQVSGFSIERMKHLDCGQLQNSAGGMQYCTHRFVFFTNVEKDYKKCLSKMVLCMNMKEAALEEGE